MVRYYEKNLNLISLIRKKWLLIGIILIFGLVKVNAEPRCCYSTVSELKTPPNSYLLNLTASHVDSRKGNNKYAAAISFKEGYTVVGEPYSPFNKVVCTQTPGTGSITQYQCDSKDNAMFFVIFQLSVRFLSDPNSSNTSDSSITVSEVFIFGDKCQNTAFCTDLAAKGEGDDDDKISLGPLGTWPRYAVIIGGIILGISLLVACYLVYRRNRPDYRYRDRSTTPGTQNYEDKIFSPNSLLRDDDSSPPSDEPPKNTLIQFGSVTAHSPERTKSVRNKNQHTSLTKSSTTKKKNENKNSKSDDYGGKIPEKDHQEIKIHDNYDNSKSDDYGDKVLDKDHGKTSSVVIKIPDGGEMEKPSRKTRKNHDKDNKNLKANSTSDLSKTISNNDPSDRELGGDNEYKRSTSVRRKKSKSGSKSRSKSINHGESRRDKKSTNNNDSNKLRKSSTLRDAGEDRESRRIDHTSSKGHRSRNDSSSPSSAPKSASDLQKGPSIRARQSDRDLTTRNKRTISQHQDDKGAGKNNRLSRSATNLDRKKSRDVVSDGDLESTSDRLPLAMLARSPTKSGQSKSWKSDGENDDDTTPLGRISSYSIGKTNSSGTTSSNTHLITSDKSSEDNNDYSVLDDLLAEDDNYPIGKRLSNIGKE